MKGKKKKGGEGGGIKKFLADNGEKFGLGAAVLCLLYFAYSAWGRPTIGPSEQPQAIKQKAADAIALIDRGEVTPEKVEGTAVSILAAAKQSMSEIPDTAYDIKPYKPLVFQPFMKRGEPQLYPAEKLIASAGRGAVAYLPNGQVRGQGFGGGSMEAMSGMSGSYMSPSADRAMNPQPTYDPSASIMEAMKARGGKAPKKGKSIKKGARGSSSGMMPGSSGGMSSDMYSGTESSDMSGMYGAPQSAPTGGVSAPGSEPTGKRWASVLAVVDFAKQQEAFSQAFDEAVKPEFAHQQFQIPFYSYIDVERAEVNAAGETTAWQPVSVKAMVSETERWFTAQVNDVADPLHKDLYLTMELPPLLDRAWGPEGNHPDIPEMQVQQGGQYGMMPGGQMPSGATKGGDEEEAAEPQPVEIIDPLSPEAIKRGGSSGYGGGGMYGGSGMSGMSSMPGMSGMSGMSGSPDLGASDYGMYGGGMYGGATQRIIDKKLVRFFDFSVEPGKQYKYRIRLNVGNPNFEVAAKFLQNPAANEKPALQTEWSEPTPVVAVPEDHQLFALSASAARSPAAGPSARVGIVAWNEDLNHEEMPEFGPAEAAIEESIGIGDVASYVRETNVMNFSAGGSTTIEKFPFQPNLLLADIRGGGIPGNRKLPDEPAELLLIDEEGGFVVRSQLEDSAKFAEQKKALEVPEPTAAPAAADMMYSGGSPDLEGMSMPGMSMPGMSMPGMSTGPQKGRGRPKGARGGSSSGMVEPGLTP